MQKINEAHKLTDIIIKSIQEKKGKEIVLLDLKSVGSSVCDYFIICHGDSTRQVHAIADFIREETIKRLKVKPWFDEGYENARWILLDYVDVVVHIFLKEAREYYNLEGLWADAVVEKINI